MALALEPTELLDATEPRRARRRLRLLQVTDSRVEGSYRAHVVLEAPGGARYEGRAQLPAAGQNYLRTACRATLAAMGPLLGDDAELQLVGVDRVSFAGGDVIVVQIASRIRGRPELLQGAAVAGDSPELDAARAVLHATNRRIGRLLKA
jgi:hypothetical protein